MSKRFRWTLFFSLVWIGVIAFGLAVLWDYSNKPGLPATAQLNWPEKTGLERDLNLPTFIMFAHPHCDCSEASLGELNEIMAQVNSQLHVMIVFVTPKDAGPSWKNTHLWKSARLIPKAQIILDEGGKIADQFGAHTSGQVLLYDKQGQLVFSGGITGARGHSGDNLGKSSVTSFVNEHQLEHPSTPVFGCALKEYDDAEKS